ncbi:MAG: hypothetical protein WD491_14345 [Balneolales bacterium]
MNILEILIILFLIFPFIKRIIDGMKQREQQSPEDQQQQKTGGDEPNPWEAPDDYSWGEPEQKQEKPKPGGSWDDTLQELEDLFAGRPSHREKEKPVPAPKPEPATHTASRSVSSEAATKNQKPEAPIGSVDASSDLVNTENPIYKSLDVAPEVIAIEETKIRDYSKDLHEPGALRHAFVLKEILDTPSSLRRVRRTPNGY